jgi:hypothetical protein
LESQTYLRKRLSVHTNTKDLIEVLKEENLLPKKILKDLLVFIEDYKNEDFLELQELLINNPLLAYISVKSTIACPLSRDSP